jgi:PAS domain S-box-containing protein
MAPSVRDLDAFTRIKQILKENPQGMSVTELAAALGHTKNTVGRYLDILHASGQVEMRTYGMAKVFTLTQRVPVSQLLSHAPECVMILDRDARVLQMNDPFLALLALTRDAVVGRNLGLLPVSDPTILEMVQSLITAIRSGKSDIDLHLAGEKERYFHAKVIPIVFEDGGQGNTVILIDFTTVRLAEKALRESEKKYRELVENANSIILKMDLEGNVTFFNEFAERFFGFSREEILGKSVIGTIVPPTESSGRDLAHMIRDLLLRTEAFQDNENENITKDGRRVWVRWSNKTITGEDGGTIGVLSIGSDITEHRRLDEQIRASERVLRDLVDMLPQPVFEADASGTVLFANRQAYRTFGYTPEDLPGRVNVLAIIAPEDHARARASIDRLLREGKLGREEYTGVRKDGSRFPLIDYAAPIYDGTRIVGFRGIAIDLTAQKETEAALRRERDFTDAILHVLDALVVVLDREGQIVRFNHACEKLTGYLEPEVQGIPFWNVFLLPEEVAQVRGVFDALIAQRGDLRCSNYWVTKGGERRFIHWSNTSMADESGKVTHVIATGMEAPSVGSDQKQ